MNPDLLKHLDLAEIYLLDGAPGTALRHIRKALEITNPDLPDGEDHGDVSDHLLREAQS